MNESFGPVVFFGSGETSASAQPIYEHVMRSLTAPIPVSVLETPAGFQLNSSAVAETVADYVRIHLQNYRPAVSVIPARKKGTEMSPDNLDILGPMLTSQMIFLGPGSPTYAARQLRDSLAWQILQARHRMGYPVTMASAATIAASRWALPVYEIYKVGEELHWQPGLDFWKSFGLSIVLIPHWNNNEGGEKHDTSRCYMGQPRFDALLGLLNKEATVIGIDEHTALVVDPNQQSCRVMGVGGVTLVQGDDSRHFESGEMFPCGALGAWSTPKREDTPKQIWEVIGAAEKDLAANARPSPEVMALVAQRELARKSRAWGASDQLRDEIVALGWQVHDTPKGSELAPIK